MDRFGPPGYWVGWASKNGLARRVTVAMITNYVLDKTGSPPEYKVFSLSLTSGSGKSLMIISRRPIGLYLFILSSVVRIILS